jgi:hypothetical protein
MQWFGSEGTYRNKVLDGSTGRNMFGQRQQQGRATWLTIESENIAMNTLPDPLLCISTLRNTVHLIHYLVNP